MRELTKTELYVRTAERLQALGEDARFLPSYSGRGMYGATTPALKTEGSVVAVGWELAQACAELGGCPDHGREELLPERRDSLGRGTVLY